MSVEQLELLMPIAFVLLSGGIIVGAIFMILNFRQKKRDHIADMQNKALEEAEAKAREAEANLEIAKANAEIEAYELEQKQFLKEIKELDALIYQYNMFILVRLGGIQFEQFVGKMLQKLGYTDVKVTQASGDKGGDVIATDPTGVKTCFQCKRYSKEVGISAVQEVYAAAGYYECEAAAVITNSNFTPQAMELAGKIGVELWDGECLSGMMEKCKTEVFELLHERLRRAKNTAEEMRFKDAASTESRTPLSGNNVVPVSPEIVFNKHKDADRAVVIEHDPLLRQALEIAFEKDSGYVSVSRLMVNISVDYNRAKLMIEEMEHRGIIENEDGPLLRKVIIRKDQLDDYCS